MVLECESVDNLGRAIDHTAAQSSKYEAFGLAEGSGVVGKVLEFEGTLGKPAHMVLATARHHGHMI